MTRMYARSRSAAVPKRSAAHRLSGSLGVLAARQALEAAKRVEHLSAGGDREALDTAITALEHEVAEAVGPLETFYAATRLARPA